jgi:hypothetical protein
VKKFFPSWTRWYQINWFKGDIDKRFTMTKTEEALLKKNPGTTLSRYSSCGNLVYAALFDERPLSMLTNCNIPTGEDAMGHWFPARRGERAQSANGKILSFYPSVT